MTDAADPAVQALRDRLEARLADLNNAAPEAKDAARARAEEVLAALQELEAAAGLAVTQVTLGVKSYVVTTQYQCEAVVTVQATDPAQAATLAIEQVKAEHACNHVGCRTIVEPTASCVAEAPA